MSGHTEADHPDHMDLETLKFVTVKSYAMFQVWAGFMGEIDAKATPARWLVEFTTLMESLQRISELMVDEAEYHGFKLPPQEPPE